MEAQKVPLSDACFDSSMGLQPRKNEVLRSYIKTKKSTGLIEFLMKRDKKWQRQLTTETV